MGSGGRGKYILIAILLVASFFRFYGINFGLPFIYDPDEPIFVNHAIVMLRNHDPNPHWFGAPASPTIYLVAGIAATQYAIGKISGKYSNPIEFRDSYFLDPGIVYLPGRILFALFGIASVFLLYKVALRISKQPVALVAAAMLAISPLHVEYSKYIRMDVQLGFFLLLAFWFCLNIFQRQDFKSYLIAGFLIGVASVTKYYGIFFGVVYLLSHFLAVGFSTKHIKPFIVGLVMIVVGAFLAAPFVFLDYKAVLRDVHIEAVAEFVGLPRGNFIDNVIWFVMKASVDSVGRIGVLMVCIGFILLILKERKIGVLVVAFPLVLILFLSTLGIRWERWIVPAVPYLCILASISIFAISDYFGRLSPRLVPVVAILLVATTIFPLVQVSFIQSRELSGGDTRTEAFNWMLQNIPSGSKVLGEAYTPQLPGDRYDMFYIRDDGELRQANSKRSAHYRLGGHIGKVRTLDKVKEAGIQYVVMSHMYNRYLNDRRYPAALQKYEAVMNGSTLLYEVKREPGKNRGPHVRVFRLDLHR
jgi:hypothetical protein